jgi:hypothetical protein
MYKLREYDAEALETSAFPPATPTINHRNKRKNGCPIPEQFFDGWEHLPVRRAFAAYSKLQIPSAYYHHARWKVQRSRRPELEV